jgi:tRNA(Arg) A34 adenosine deaminase TadA
MEELREDYIDKVIDLAKHSEGKSRHACICLDKRGHIVSYATNSRKTHPLQAEYARRTGKPQKVSLHAEIASLIRAASAVSTVIVARINKNGELRNSKPCPICSLALQEAQVEEVWFSTDKGFEKLSDNERNKHD